MSRRGLVLLATWAVCALTPVAASADTFKPTRFDDPAPNGCKPKDCSLREAISRSNHQEGADKVVLSSGTYDIEIPETLGDNNKGGDLDVTDAATITGKGVGKTIVDGNDVSGVFSLLTFPAKTISKMTIENGNRNFGAGIATGPSKTTIRNVRLESNSASGDPGKGGGLYTVSQKLKIVKTTFFDNSAANGGGGMYVPAGFVGEPTGTIKDSTFDSNSGALGGGIYLDGANTFGNDDLADIKLVNSTVAQNLAAVSGGGIASILGMQIHLDNTTVTFNEADSDNSGGGAGGGLFQSSNAELAIKDSLIAQNGLGTGGTGPQCSGIIVGPSIMAPAAPDCTTTATIVPNAMIGGLDDYGGPTKTVALLTGSPAIDPPAVDCPEFDQRGRKRDSQCDAGAFERKASDP